MRHFIEDALYHPTEGYFVKNANIFRLTEPLNIPNMKDMDEYQTTLSRLYKGSSKTQSFYQLWHTPSELFQPHFSEAIGNYLLKSRSNNDPLVIYEIGPGTGTFCSGLSSFLDRSAIQYEYNLIDISSTLHDIQRDRFKGNSRIHPRHVSFFDLDRIEKRPCVIIALEVWDNFAQDIIAFSDNGDLLQGVVEIDNDARPYDIPGMYNVCFEPASDPLILNTFNVMDNLKYKWKSLKWSPKQLFKFLGYDQSYKWQYIPTRIYEFMNKVHINFPQSRLLMSDFDMLPDTTPGFGAPVVQTRYNGDTVSCSSVLLKKGLFDIFFPVDFGLMAGIYNRTTGKSATVMKHREFLSCYADLIKTRTKSGYNPMMEEFENVSFMLS